MNLGVRNEFCRLHVYFYGFSCVALDLDNQVREIADWELGKGNSDFKVADSKLPIQSGASSQDSDVF